MLARLSLLMLLCASGCPAPPCDAARTAADPPRDAAGTAADPAGRTLPSIELLTLEGSAVRLDAALSGRPAVVSLWATWCEACSSEFPALERLSQRAQAKGGTVLAVAVGEPRQKVADFVRWRHLAYPQLVDEKFALADALGEKRVPTTLVVDRHGRVVFTGGALDAPAIAALSAQIDR